MCLSFFASPLSFSILFLPSSLDLSFSLFLSFHLSTCRPTSKFIGQLSGNFKSFLLNSLPMGVRKMRYLLQLSSQKLCKYCLLPLQLIDTNVCCSAYWMSWIVRWRCPGGVSFNKRVNEGTVWFMNVFHLEKHVDVFFLWPSGRPIIQIMTQ